MFCQLLVDFGICLEQMFKQIKLFWFTIEGRHCCRERGGQSAISVNFASEVGGNAVHRQLLSGKQILVFIKFRRGVLTVDMWLT